MDGDAALARQRTGRVSGTKPAPSSAWVPAGVGPTDAPQRHSAGVPGWVAGRRRTILAPCSAGPERRFHLGHDAQRVHGTITPHPGDDLSCQLPL